MADAAAARREARRKRILENSQNRLQLISGKSSESSGLDSKIKLTYSDPIFDDTIASSSSSIEPPMNNGVIVTEDSRGLLSGTEDSVAAGDNQIPNDLAAFLSPTPPDNTPVTTVNKLVSSKYDVVIFSLIYQALHILFSYEADFFFLPLVIQSVTKMIWYPAPYKSNIAFLIMVGLAPNHGNFILKVIQYVTTITQDVCVYLFTTICIQSLLCMLRDITVT